MIQRTPQFITSTELRTKLDSALDTCQREPVYILKHSKIVAVMVGHQKWEQIRDDIFTAQKQAAEAWAAHEQAQAESEQPQS